MNTFTIGAVALLLGASQLSGQDFAATLRQQLDTSRQQLANYQEQLIDEKAQDYDSSQSDTLHDLVEATTVKETLYKNFVGTPTLNDPQVQAELTRIFSLQKIRPSDLENLEKITDAAKANVGQ